MSFRTVDCLRLSDGPPSEEARGSLDGGEVGDQVIIIRRGPLLQLLQYDASLWEVVTLIDDVPVPWLCRVGFGFTRRGALRSMWKRGAV